MEILSSSLFGGGRQIKICLDLENGSFQMMNNICDPFQMLPVSNAVYAYRLHFELSCRVSNGC